MTKLSAGLLVYKIEYNIVKVLLGHMGGPFYAKKDFGAWDIPKGEFEGEDAMVAAHREFEEEIGQPAPSGTALELGDIRTSGKVVMIWAIEGDIDVSKVRSNTFQMEWPPKSGQLQEFPEIDRAEWFDIATARHKIVKSRIVFLERLIDLLRSCYPRLQFNTSPTEEKYPEQSSLF